MTNPYDDIRRERVRQDEMHGPRLDVNDIPRVLGEEFGEVCKAINDREPIARVREELVQCAAVCVKAIESIDRGDAMPPSERRGFVTHDPSKAVRATGRPFVGDVWSFSPFTGQVRLDGMLDCVSDAGHSFRRVKGEGFDVCTRCGVAAKRSGRPFPDELLVKGGDE